MKIVVVKCDDHGNIDLNDLREKLACGSNKRLTLDVFVRARCLADKHQVGIKVSHPENHVPARRRKVRAFSTL